MGHLHHRNGESPHAGVHGHPTDPLHLNKEINDKECKPLRKQNSVFINAKCNAAFKGVLRLSVESRPDVRKAIERTLEHHEPDAKHHYAYKNMAAVTKKRKPAPRKSVKSSVLKPLKLTGISDETKKALGMAKTGSNVIVIEDPTVAGEKGFNTKPPK